MEQRSTQIISYVILAVGIFLGAKSLADALVYFRNFDKIVDVKGLAEKQVKSNLASWSINYNITGDDIKELYEIMNQNQKSINDFLIKNGFKQEEISQKSASVSDSWANNYSNSNQKSPRYQISTGVDIATKNVDFVEVAKQKLSELINDGVILSYNSVNYIYDGLNDIKSQMIDEATQNAKKSAEVFAKNTNSKINGIKYANQGVFSISSSDGLYSNDTTSLMKKVRVVTTVQFFIK